MRASNERPPLTLRANALRTTRDALAERLEAEEGLAVRPTRHAPEGLVVGPVVLSLVLSAFRIYRHDILRWRQESTGRSGAFAVVEGPTGTYR